jgi:hypothetical protein
MADPFFNVHGLPLGTQHVEVWMRDTRKTESVIEGAYAGFDENAKGSIRRCKLADLTVIGGHY